MRAKLDLETIKYIKIHEQVKRVKDPRSQLKRTRSDDLVGMMRRSRRPAPFLPFPKRGILGCIKHKQNFFVFLFLQWICENTNPSPLFSPNPPWTFIGMFITARETPPKPRFRRFCLLLHRPPTSPKPRKTPNFPKMKLSLPSFRIPKPFFQIKTQIA